MALKNPPSLQVGQKIEVVIEKVAHGGHFIVRHGGVVIFVRHGIPGEKALIEISSVGTKFSRADVIEVLRESEDRVIAPCPVAHARGCGGCDFQHISIDRQRKLKSEVITEQFSRIAKMEINVEVEEIAHNLRWRTRAVATTDSDGRLGFYASRTNRVVAITDCLIAHESLRMGELAARKWASDMRVEVAVSSLGERSIATAPIGGQTPFRMQEGPAALTQIVGAAALTVSQQSFWQSHYRAPEALTEAVLGFAEIRAGDEVLDLYGGVGLFSAAAARATGELGKVTLVEASKSASADAAKNFALNPSVKVLRGSVDKVLPRISKADVIILDPPRAGAGKVVVLEICRIRARKIVYVACDPAALARDTTYFAEHGYRLAKLRAFDLFPMTHHMECIALFEPSDVS